MDANAITPGGQTAASEKQGKYLSVKQIRSKHRSAEKVPDSLDKFSKNLDSATTSLMRMSPVRQSGSKPQAFAIRQLAGHNKSPQNQKQKTGEQSHL